VNTLCRWYSTVFWLRNRRAATSPLEWPAAASLADDRALFRDVDWPHEHVEKFKPYSVASLYSFAETAFAEAAFRSPA